MIETLNPNSLGSPLAVELGLKSLEQTESLVTFLALFAGNHLNSKQKLIVRWASVLGDKYHGGVFSNAWSSYVEIVKHVEPMTFQQANELLRATPEELITLWVQHRLTR